MVLGSVGIFWKVLFSTPLVIYVVLFGSDWNRGLGDLQSTGRVTQKGGDKSYNQ